MLVFCVLFSCVLLPVCDHLLYSSFVYCFSPKHVFKEGKISCTIVHQYSNCYGVGPPFPGLDLLDYGLGKNRACIWSYILIIITSSCARSARFATCARSSLRFNYFVLWSSASLLLHSTCIIQTCEWTLPWLQLGTVVPMSKIRRQLDLVLLLSGHVIQHLPNNPHAHAHYW